MDLNERKKRILQAVIDEYIGTAEPVGSRAISKKHDLDLSSATIRNEMADLEEMGYLIQPYTSAGRIPSDAGYRFYVNSLMRNYRIGMEAVARLQNELQERVNKLDLIIKRAAVMASAMTDYTAFVTAPQVKSAVINKIDLVPISQNAVMLIVVTDTVRSRLMNVGLDGETCRSLAEIFNSKLVGMSAQGISFETIKELEESIQAQHELHPKVLISIMNFVYETISDADDAEIYIQNAKSILRYPEYSDVGKAQKLFEFFENKEGLKRLADMSAEKGVTAKIGGENEDETLRDCSLVTVNYSLGGHNAGKIGIIGPKRMDYAKVFASLDLISSEIDRLIELYLKGE